jgi:hypothetical protein
MERACPMTGQALFYLHSSKYAIGVAIISVKIVRSTQITNNFGIVIGISVAKIQGITAEKNKMAEIETTAMMNLVTRGASVTNHTYRNIA